MNTEIALEKCHAFIGCQMKPAEKPTSASQNERPRPAVTISRETGSGGISIAEKLAEYLQAHDRDTTCPWTVFHKNLVEKVLADHSLPQRLAQFMPEDRVSAIQDMVEEVLGLHPSSWTLVRQTTETILHLAELGHVILVGRAANVITGKLENVFHVRLVGSLENRIERVQSFFHIGEKAALQFIRKEEQGRKRYLKKHFRQSIDDPLLYDLVINTDRFTQEEAARLIGDALLHRFR